MNYRTREKAEQAIRELRQKQIERGRTPAEYRIVEKWGSYDVFIVKECQRCGGEALWRGGTSQILCEACWDRQEHEATQRADIDAAKARRRKAAYDDFEEVCQ